MKVSLIKGVILSRGVVFHPTWSKKKKCKISFFYNNIKINFNTVFVIIVMLLVHRHIINNPVWYKSQYPSPFLLHRQLSSRVQCSFLLYIDKVIDDFSCQSPYYSSWVIDIKQFFCSP